MLSRGGDEMPKPAGVVPDKLEHSASEGPKLGRAFGTNGMDGGAVA